MKKKLGIYQWGQLEDKKPVHIVVKNTDLVLIRYDDNISVFYGRCLHQGARLGDGHISGHNLICGVHNWDYRYDTGISEYNNEEQLHKFTALVEDGQVYIDEEEIDEFEKNEPSPVNRDDYLSQYEATEPTPEEPKISEIHNLAKNGLQGTHGSIVAMGVPSQELPKWDDIQILPVQLGRFPLFADAHVGTDVTIGKNANKPLTLDIPIFITDMSFGSLSEEAKVALAKGAEQVGTGICSGEGGMLPEEKAECSKYFFELGPAKFGFKMDIVKEVQAFHFKGGQATKTGIGGYLPGYKNVGKISQIRGTTEGEDVLSPARILDLDSVNDYRLFCNRVREVSGGIPIGFKLSANHIEQDIDIALRIGVDYIILDGRGGGTGASPTLFRDHISIPTIPALARARHHLDRMGRKDIALIITGGLRTAPDFIKAIALGADAIAIGNAAIQAIGCQSMRACNTDNCPVGIATQKPYLRKRLDINKSAQRLLNFLTASVQQMQIMARACGHDHLSQFCLDDLTTFNREMAYLSGISYGGISSL